MKAIIYGVLAALFFSSTFLINRMMNLAGGSWIWSAVLRHLFMAILLCPLMLRNNRFKVLFVHIKEHVLDWFLWSLIGFGVFYSALTFGSSYGPAWLIAGTFQFTIIAGILLTPLFYEEVSQGGQVVKSRKKIPKKALAISSLIFLGVILMQLEHANSVSFKEIFLCVIPVMVAAFAYPLGNRKMMEVCEGKIDALSRTFGMTIMSLPYWFILGAFGIITVGAPSGNQIIQSFIVALSAGIIATILYFKATEIVKDDPQQLAVIEGTVSLELVFTLINEVLFLHVAIPAITGIVGIVLVVGGIFLNNYLTFTPTTKEEYEG